jgi:hypothetical protein
MKLLCYISNIILLASVLFLLLVVHRQKKATKTYLALLEQISNENTELTNIKTFRQIESFLNGTKLSDSITITKW